MISKPLYYFLFLLGCKLRKVGNYFSNLILGGDITFDTDNAYDIGSTTEGLEELHIATDILLTEVAGGALGLRNSANDGNQNMSIGASLNMEGKNALAATTSRLSLGGVETGPKLPSLTTTQKNALSAIVGHMVYDSVLERFEHVINGTTWESLSPTKDDFYGVHAEDTIFKYACHSLVGALTDNYTGVFPHDMKEIIQMVIVVIPKQDDIVLSWITVNASNTETGDTHTDNGSINLSAGGLIDKIFEIDITTEFATALKNDYFGIEVTGNGGDTIKILGIRLRYR